MVLVRCHPEGRTGHPLKDQFAGLPGRHPAWIVQGAVAWYKDGLGIPESVASTGRGLSPQTPLVVAQHVFRDRRRRTDGAGSQCVRALFVRRRRARHAIPMSKRALAQKLDDRGYPSQKVGNQMYRLKLSIKKNAGRC